MNAVDRAIEMMYIPQNKLPPLAYEFANKLCRQVGMCMEVYITAFAVYAQCVEKLPCNDALYKARDEDVEWFEKRILENQSN